MGSALNNSTTNNDSNSTEMESCINYSSVLKQHDVNIDTIYLVCGYIRLIEILNKIIPTSIIQICIKFYGIYQSKLFIAYISSNTKSKKTIIKIAEMNTRKLYECNIQPLNASEYAYVPPTHNHLSAVRYVKDFNFPKHLMTRPGEKHKLNWQHSYNVIFRVDNSSKWDCPYAYIINATQIGKNEIIDTFYWKLPMFQSDPYCSVLQYSPKHGLITQFTLTHSLRILQFSQQIETKLNWKWIELEMKRKRYNLSAEMISDDELICCGGVFMGSVLRVVEKYNFVTKKWKKLANMHNKRICAGICTEKKQKQRVYVSGGQFAATKHEYYDINKGKWYKLPDTNAKHTWNPIVWTKGANILNIASCDANVFERIDLRENKWRVYITYDSFKNFFRSEIALGATDHFSHRLCI